VPVRPPRGRPPTVEPGEAVTLDDDALTALVRRVLADPHRRVVWTGPGIDLLVRLDQTRAASVDGGVVIGFEVDGGEGITSATATIAVGSTKQPAGMVAAAAEPDLPAALTVWSDAVVAAAWRGLLEAAATAVAPLVPVALIATRGRLDVVPRPRHRWER
jgi:hypothetical protein